MARTRTPAPTTSYGDLLAGARDRFDAERAERDLDPGTWADQHLHLPRGDGPTRHRSGLTPYWRHWHRRVRARVTSTALAEDPAAHRAERLSLICAAQVGKTNGWIVPTLAWIAATRPRDCGIVLPSEDAAKSWARDRLAQVFALSPRLDALLPAGQSARERRLGPKAWHLDRCLFHFLNGAVAGDLKSRDLPLMLLDEFDALPASVLTRGKPEGSPIALALERQNTFPLIRLMLAVTTPTTVDSHGWASLCAGTHERLLFACPACGAHQWPDPVRVEPLATSDTLAEIVAGDSAAYRCERCGHQLRTDDLHAAIARACEAPAWTDAGGWVPGSWEQHLNGGGRWEPAAQVNADTGRIAAVPPAEGRHLTGWLSALYSRFITLGQFLAHERTADRARDTDRQAHWNNWRCEPWTPSTATLDDGTVRIATVAGEGYQHGQLPHAVDWVVLSLDQQGQFWDKSWFPWVLHGWNKATEECWLIDCGTCANPAELDAMPGRVWPVGGVGRRADVITMDTANGVLARPIRTWCAAEPRRRFALGGSGVMTDPSVLFSEVQLSEKNRDRLCGLPVLFFYNAGALRDMLYDRIRGADGAPRWHIAADAPQFYRDSLQSEERVIRDVIVRGRRDRRPVWEKRTWIDTRGIVHTREDNHWWDASTQNLAAVHCLRLLTVKPPVQRRTIGAIGA